MIKYIIFFIIIYFNVCKSDCFHRMTLDNFNMTRDRTKNKQTNYFHLLTIVDITKDV